MAVLIAGTVLMSTFLPRDLPPIVEAFHHRAEERVLGMEKWERDWSDVIERHEPKPHRHAYSIGEGVERWRSLVEQYFRPEDVPWAMAVMGCESGGNPNAKNPDSTASGLFQHLASFWPERAVKAGWAGADIFDPEANVAVAAWLRDTKGGRGHWTCTKKVTW